MKILFIGDIVAKPGREAVIDVLSSIDKSQFDFIIGNCENLAHGRGITLKTLAEMTDAGVDFFTGGDHLFWNEEFQMNADNLPIVRPCNYPSEVWGKSYEILTSKKSGERLLVTNALGRTFLNERVDDPFAGVETILNANIGNYDYSLVDFHAEASSEKMAFAFNFARRVSAIVGTHTHIPTCDARVIDSTLYITDVGMTGNLDSVLGVKKEIILSLYKTALNQRFEWENYGKKAFRGVIIDLKNKKIERFDKEFEK